MKKNKHNLPVFDSDHDLLKAFQNISGENQNTPAVSQDRPLHAIHTVKAVNDPPDINNMNDPNDSNQEEEESFAVLLEEYFQKNAIKPVKKSPPVPIKKRLKRYPTPEAVLDLHGYKAIEAKLRAESFIHTCKMQGFFTIRIIVGKGKHSELGPVLPDVVEDVLNDMKEKNLVLGFDWDKKLKSKSGSVIIYIQQFERYDD